MATTFDYEGEPVVDLRPDIILLDGELRERTCDVKPRQGIGAGVYGSRLGKYRVHEALENLELPPQRAVGGGGDFRLELAELGGGEARLPGKRLTVNERCIERRSHQFLAMLGGDLDEIPQHVVMPNLQRFNARLFGISRLQRGYDAARLVPQRACFVKRGVITIPHEAAIALDERQIRGKRGRQFGM